MLLCHTRWRQSRGSPPKRTSTSCRVASRLAQTSTSVHAQNIVVIVALILRQEQLSNVCPIGSPWERRDSQSESRESRAGRHSEMNFLLCILPSFFQRAISTTPPSRSGFPPSTTQLKVSLAINHKGPIWRGEQTIVALSPALPPQKYSPLAL